jgi:hypothetical protein
MSENGAKVIAGVREVATERPDHVFGEMRVYVYGDEPRCLVGHGLWRAGLIDRKFIKRRIANGASITSFEMRDVLKGFDQDEIDWLAMVQDQQDPRHTWSKSVEWADQVMSVLRAAVSVTSANV